MNPKWAWPLPNNVPWEIPAGNDDGGFGHERKHDIHTGVDLHCPDGWPVHAVEDGVVVRTENFTGKDAGSDWWNDTRAILIEGVSGVVCYGEIEELENLFPETAVKRGQIIGHVKRVLKEDREDGKTSMLHLELYREGFRGETAVWKLGTPIPGSLLDPTPFLKAAWARVTNRFHRDVPRRPSDTASRRAAIMKLVTHLLWEHPSSVRMPPDGESPFDTKIPESEWKDVVVSDGSFHDRVDIDVAWVDPTMEHMRGDWPDGLDDRDIAFRVWIEAGGWMDISSDPDESVPEGGWNDDNRWAGVMDTELFCGGSDLQEALLNLADRVEFYYNDDGTDREGSSRRCGCGVPYGTPFEPCKDAGDGFCAVCGHLVEEHWEKEDFEESSEPEEKA